jgi:hypothetical protein
MWPALGSKSPAAIPLLPGLQVDCVQTAFSAQDANWLQGVRGKTHEPLRAQLSDIRAALCCHGLSRGVVFSPPLL